jgi:hypothetical protein
MDGQTSRIGVGLKKEVDGFMRKLKPADLAVGSSKSVLADLMQGRALTQRIKKSETVSKAVEKGQRRAATSGTGGNEVNAIRQNIRSILDNPKKSRGFNAMEKELMEKITRGTPATNSLRQVGRLSPTSGALPMMGFGASSATFGPLGAAPSVAGYIAKQGAEALTKRQIDNLDELIRNGGALGKKGVNQIEKSTFAALLASKLANGGHTPQ